MTRAQEIPWVEKVAVSTPTAKFRKHSRSARRINIYRLRWIKPLIESRWPQFLIRLLTLCGFIFTIAVGLFGSRVGSHNFAIIFVWIAWWSALKLLFIPFGGRSWCSVCPIPLPGEWLQRGGILKPGQHKLGLNLRWPKWLRRSWLQSGSFLLIGLFSAVTLTDPKVTGWVLLGIFVMATGLSLIFERRPFCTTFCPIGGFSGMYAQTSPVEVRVIDKEICRKHEQKKCYQACPWGLYPVAFRDNTACGTCMECLRACPHDNLALNLRPFSADLGQYKTTSRLDEAFLALVMLGSVITFTAIFTGPWGWMKLAAFEIGSGRWFGYAGSYLVLTMLILPALFALAVWVGERLNPSGITFKRTIANQAQMLLPLGLMAWIAFTISFALPKLNLILTVLNDPLGLGWNILSPMDTSNMLSINGVSTFLQAMCLLVGMFWSAHISGKLSGSAEGSRSRINLPVLLFAVVFTMTMLWLLVG